MTNRTLRKTIYLRATPETVWAYLTDPDKLSTWFHAPKAPLVEGRFEMFGTTSGDLLIWGEVLRAEPFRHLDYSFTVKPMGDAVSTVRWTLTPVEGGTELALIHEGLPHSAEAFDLTLNLDKGWDDHLGRLRATLHG